MNPNETQPNGASGIESASPQPPVRSRGSGEPWRGNGHLINLVAAVITSTYMITHSIKATVIVACSVMLLALLGQRSS